MAQDTFTIYKWSMDGPHALWTGTPGSDDAPIAWIELLRAEGPNMEIGDQIDLNEWHYAVKVAPLRIVTTVPFTAPAFATSRAEIVVTEYNNGVLGLLITDLAGESLDPDEQEVLTVNLSGHGMTPGPRCVHVPDYGPHKGVGPALVKADLATIINRVTYGFCTGYLLRLEGALATTSHRHDIAEETRA